MQGLPPKTAYFMVMSCSAIQRSYRQMKENGQIPIFGTNSVLYSFSFIKTVSRLTLMTINHEGTVTFGLKLGAPIQISSHKLHRHDSNPVKHCRKGFQPLPFNYKRQYYQCHIMADWFTLQMLSA